MMQELENLIGEDERVLYRGKPDKKCYIYESAFNPMLPFALLWAIFDISFMKEFFPGFSGFGGITLFLVGFFAIHMMPVWIYLGGILFAVKRYKNTAYVVTDQAIYVSSGLFTYSITRKSFAELSNINLHRGVFDRMFNVGDIIATTDQRDSNGQLASVCIGSISDYTAVYNMIKKLQLDIYTDIMYPNDLRPKENHGYNTEYKGM